jgi:hypothetical protein
VHPQFSECVVYLCAEELGDDGHAAYRPRAAGFFAQVDVPEQGDREGGVAVYLVTANHVVAEAYAAAGSLFAEVNLTEGGVDHFPLPRQSWFSDDSVDAAIGRFRFPYADLDFVSVPLRIFAHEAELSSQRAAEGALVFAASLYAALPGARRALPVFRFGRIARMPKEPLPLKFDEVSDSRPMPAYLCELAAWGGGSGSPVFIEYGSSRSLGRNHGLLGLLHGHFDVPAAVSSVARATATDEDREAAQRIGLNSGLAAVIRAEDIRDLLLRDDVAAARDRDGPEP